jgi:Asp-tRNA(Asn)/Glu-tRNA(Gln) amidotransferase B subunit
VALMEIVSKPDLRSSEEAKAYVAKLRTILRYLAPAMATWRRAICAPT